MTLRGKVLIASTTGGRNMKPVIAKPGLFRDRREAGRLLAEKLAAYANRPDGDTAARQRQHEPANKA
jgi:hypothetical protein